MNIEKDYSNCGGLSSAEAQANLKKFGRNVVVEQKRLGAVLIFFSKFKNPLFLLMIGISAVSLAVGQNTSAIIVLMMVFLSAILDFLNTYKSQKVVMKLVSRVTTQISVVRDKTKKEVDIKDIVPGDVVFLSAGNVIPADCEIIESDDFFVNQSSLTGESIPVEKVCPVSKPEDGSSELESDGLVFMGTSVVSGFALARVVRTGKLTEFGKIAQKLSGEEPKTDFEINILKFGVFIMKVVFIMVSFVFMVYMYKNVGHLTTAVVLEAFTFALAITIGVTPDMLPAIVTVCLSKGSQLMAKKNVVVKQLASIENFGSMDILCTDKTGTLTQDHIALVKCIDFLENESEVVLKMGHLSSHFHTGVENPLDGAINEFKDIDVSQYQKIDEIPYDFQRKRSSMVVELSGKRILITKGAPEEVLKVCTKYELAGEMGSLKSRYQEIEDKFSSLSAGGFRVLAICYKDLPSSQAVSYEKTEEQEMIFLGFLAFLDPPKEGVKQTIEELERLGIEIKILTGDNDLLTKKICGDIGLPIKNLLTGKEMSVMNDMELTRRALEANVFARVTPEQKERIISILKKQGKVVGYMGDGINDAPALRAADVGVSVNNAVDIAKDTADIILMEKSLNTLKDGVLEGRKTFHNTMKYVLMGMSSNFGNMFSMMGAVTFLPFLPMLPAQILFNNLLYDMSQFALPSDAVDEDELLRPAHWDLKFIRKYMIVFGLISSIFDFLTFYLLYYVYSLGQHEFQTGWLIESIATQVFVVYIIRTKKLPFVQSRPSRALLLSTIAVVAIAWGAQYTILGEWMQLARLRFDIMLVIASYVLVYLGLVEVAKRIFYYFHFRKKATTR